MSFGAARMFPPSWPGTPGIAGPVSGDKGPGPTEKPEGLGSRLARFGRELLGDVLKNVNVNVKADVSGAAAAELAQLRGEASSALTFGKAVIVGVLALIVIKMVRK